MNARMLRDRRSQADRVRDDEANAFALFLLMPNPHFVREMRGIRDLLDEDALAKVAKKFRVSVPMLIVRDALEKRMREGIAARAREARHAE